MKKKKHQLFMLRLSCLYKAVLLMSPTLRKTCIFPDCLSGWIHCQQHKWHCYIAQESRYLLPIYGISGRSIWSICVPIFTCEDTHLHSWRWVHKDTITSSYKKVHKYFSVTTLRGCTLYLYVLYVFPWYFPEFSGTFQAYRPSNFRMNTSIGRWS